MSLLGLRLDLKIGRIIPTTAPVEITQALRAVEITQNDKAPSGFQLTFHDDRSPPGGEYSLVKNPLLQTGSRVILSVTVDGTPQVLMDGFLTGQQLKPAGGPSGTLFTVTGEDISVKMDMLAISFQYPALADWLIAASILARYIPLGLIPVVVPTLTSIFPTEYIPQQNQTDRSYLQELAGYYGYYFYVTPGPVAGLNYAYWGPQVRIGSRQRTLTVDIGPLSNVDSLDFVYDSLAPHFTYGMGMVGKVPVPIVLAGTTRLPAFASEPPLGNYLNLLTNPLGFLTKLVTLQLRSELFQHQGRDLLDALAMAQGRTDCSVDKVVTGQGELDTVRYGTVLRAPGLVTVRGAGSLYDGIYYLPKVSHKMTTTTGSWSYKQQFTVTREGLGTTV